MRKCVYITYVYVSEREKLQFTQFNFCVADVCSQPLPKKLHLWKTGKNRSKPVSYPVFLKQKIRSGQNRCLSGFLVDVLFKRNQKPIPTSGFAQKENLFWRQDCSKHGASFSASALANTTSSVLE